MSDFDENFERCNSRFAGLALAVDWLKREKLFRFLKHISLDLKTVKRTPRSKLEDLLVCLMTGVESLRHATFDLDEHPDRCRFQKLKRFQPVSGWALPQIKQKTRTPDQAP